MNLLNFHFQLHGIVLGAICSIGTTVAWPAAAQVAPNASEIAQYKGLHAAAQKGDVSQIEKLATLKTALNARDSNGRTPIHVAAFARQRDAIRALVKAGADINLLDNDRYDGITIASVADDEETLRVLLALGATAGQFLIDRPRLTDPEQIRQLHREIAVAFLADRDAEAVVAAERLARVAGHEPGAWRLLALTAALAALPDAPNLVFLAARKFGSTGAEDDPRG